MARFRSKISAEEWEAVKKLARGDFQIEHDPWRKPPRPPMIFGYGRCSHESSLETHIGLDVQDAKIREEIQRMLEKEAYQAYQAGEIYMDEAVSAFRKRLIVRPSGSKLNLELRDGDVVVATRVDRMFRSMKDLVLTLDDWNRRGVRVRFVDEAVDTESDMGWIFLHLLGVFAEWYSRFVSHRNKECSKRLVQLGRRANGHAPPGYKLVGAKGTRRTMHIDKEQRKIMAEIVRVRDAHGWSWIKVSDHIEKLLAQKENRQPIPTWDQGNRKWSRHRCQLGYISELEIRERARLHYEQQKQDQEKPQEA